MFIFNTNIPQIAQNSQCLGSFENLSIASFGKYYYDNAHCLRN